MWLRGGAALSGAGSARPNVRRVPAAASPVLPPDILNVAYGLISYISVGSYSCSGVSMVILV